MPYEQKDGDISLFINKDKKETKHPDYKGTAVIDGVKYQIGMWIKGEKPKTFLAGKIQVDNYKPKNDSDLEEPASNDSPF